MFVFRARGFPASGKAVEYRTATEEWVKHAHAQGFVVSLSRQYFGADGETCFTVTIKFKDLAELERAVKHIEASAEYRAYVGKVAGLTRMAPKYELHEVLIPFPR